MNYSTHKNIAIYTGKFIFAVISASSNFCLNTLLFIALPLNYTYSAAVFHHAYL